MLFIYGIAIYSSTLEGTENQHMTLDVVVLTILLLPASLFLIYIIIFKILIFVEINDKTISARTLFTKRTYYKWEEDVKHVEKNYDLYVTVDIF